jgi:exonuclease SbcC
VIPIHLEVSGLHSYREPQTVDFDEAVEDGLFGIFGPTGSGKSTLLDAMTLALYGKIDRLGGRDKTPMMNRDADELTVRYAFELGGCTLEAYRRFVWSGDSAQQRDAELRDLDAGETLASQAREVTREVERRLGMDFDKFTRAVFLPQGKFARFLEDTSSQRLELLEEIFGLDQYGEQLRKRARDRREEVKERYDRVHGTLEDELATVSEAGVQRLEARRDWAQRRVEELADREDELADQAQAARTLQATLDELQDARQRLDELEDEREAIEAKRERVERAEAAETPHATLEDLEDERGDLTEVREALDELAAEIDEADHDLEQAREQRAERVEALDERAQTLDDVRARLDQLDAEARRLDDLRKQREEARATLDEVGDDVDEAPPEAAFAGHDADELLAAIQDGLRARERVERHEDDLAEAFAERGEARLALAEKARRLAEVDERIEALGDELEQARERLREARVADEASALVDELAEGEPCPVCGAREHPAPAEAPGTPIDELEATRDDRREQLSEVRDERARLDQAVETQTQRLADAREQTSQIREELAEARERLHAHRRELPEALAELAFHEARAEVRRWRRARRAREARERLEQVDERLSKARQTFATVREALDLEAEEPTTEALEQARDRLQAAREEIEDERQRLDDRVEQAQDRRDELGEQKSKLAGREETLAGRVEDLQARLKGQLAQRPFEDAFAVRQAYVPADERGELAAEVEAFEEGLREAESEVDRLEAEVEDAEIDPGRARAVVEEHEKVKARLSEERKRLGEVENAFETERERLERKRELTERLDELEEDLTRAQRLTNLLGGRRFVEFLARDRFEHVLTQASRRLEEVSGGQYHLEGSPSEIRVVDQLGGGEDRDLRTLSGGETFMVSLSLALALSDAIQQERGGGYPPIEFFFLDEGFGSLDTDRLDQVMRMLHELVDQDVRVGLITHVEDVRGYVPRSVVVDEPTEDRGSRVEVHT